jgi:hypothetical protein
MAIIVSSMKTDSHPLTGACAGVARSVGRHAANGWPAPAPRRARIVGAAIRATGTLLLSGVLGGPAFAGDRLTATGGVAQIEGAAGGGLVPWALITGHATREQVGGSAFTTVARTGGGFELQSSGVALGIANRLELSFARQRFGLGDTVPGESIRMDILGVKLRVAGDAIYDQDSPWPQLAIGLQHKNTLDFSSVPSALGASSGSGTDVYVAATKLWLGGLAGRNVLANLTMRRTEANQFGLLGFGGPLASAPSWHPEASAAVFLTDALAIGGEWRDRPDQLSSFAEERALDVFAAWFPTRELSVTAAWVDLGNIADKPRQRGWYLSLKLSY